MRIRNGLPKDGVIRFIGVLEKMEGPFGWHFVEFPHDVQELFGKKGAVRVKGTINGVPMDRALMPTKSGIHVIVLGADLRRQAKVKAGDQAAVVLWPNAHPDVLELPEELNATLELLPEFKAHWDPLKPGMQRSILIWINSARTEATRMKRIGELLRRSETGHPWFKQARKERP